MQSVEECKSCTDPRASCSMFSNSLRSTGEEWGALRKGVIHAYLSNSMENLKSGGGGEGGGEQECRRRVESIEKHDAYFPKSWVIFLKGFGSAGEEWGALTTDEMDDVTSDAYLSNSMESLKSGGRGWGRAGGA